MDVKNDCSWNAYCNQIKTKTVERLIAPLVHLVTSLQSNNCPINQTNRDGKEILVRLQEALDHFLTIGSKIIQNYPLAVGQAFDQLNNALNDVKNLGCQLLDVGSKFIVNLHNQQYRQQIIELGRSTLLAVAKLLIMADMVDVYALLQQAQKVFDILNDTNKIDSTKELLESCTKFDAELQILTEMTKKRLKDLKNPSEQDDLQSAIAMLKVTMPIMVASSKAFVRHPELDSAKISREYAIDEMRKALNCFCNVLQGNVLQGENVEVALSCHSCITDLVQNLEEFQKRVHMDPANYNENKHRPELEELLERVISDSARIADSCNTRPERHNQIIGTTNSLREALQSVLKEYKQNGSRSDNEELDLSIVHLMNTIKDLRRHLRRAVIDHVSDAFLDTRTPLMNLVDAARSGKQLETQEAAQMFQAHADKIVNVARLVCEMSNDVDGVRVLRYAALLCEKLSPQIVNAALLLCEKPESTVIQENMQVFESVWYERLKVLTMAMDSLININDFLSVSEAHIIEDVKTGLEAICAKDGENLDQAAGRIRGRSIRICEVINNEIEQLLPSPYTENIQNATKILKEDALPKFVVRAEKIVSEVFEAEQKNIPRDVKKDFEEMIDACNLINNGIEKIRHALLMNRSPEDVDSDNEYEEDGGVTVMNEHDNCSQTSDTDLENQQKVMRQLPEESKREIQKQIDVFKVTQRKFEYEVGKWDETGNDIIALAKRMCHIMTNMTDFTKGRGPYRTTMDVIKAAQEISEYGDKLNELARQIGNESVESTTKKDLFAYLERITLFCHQLKVTSKVKADVQMVRDELRVSGLDAATSLIQNAKNLLNAVILTVKAAFIASTKYRPKESTVPRLVEWRMAPPRQQQMHSSFLIDKNNGINSNSTTRNETHVKERTPHAIIRRVSERKSQPLMQKQAEFLIR